MSTAYIGEIRAFGFAFAPLDWALCQGQLMGISQNPTLYNLIGTTFGGDGTSTFGLPNLQGRVPIHQGTIQGQISTTIGQMIGTENVTLTTGQMPAHTHTITVAQVPSGGVVERTAAPTAASYVSQSNEDGVYNTASPNLNATAAAGTIGTNGGSQPHENRQPYLVINFCIALYGVYPTQS